MTDRTELRALLERVEKATGPDWEIDAALVLLLTPDECDDDAFLDWPPYTASVDAILWLIQQRFGENLTGLVIEYPHPALSFCAALLKAEIKREEATENPSVTEADHG